MATATVTTTNGKTARGRNGKAALPPARARARASDRTVNPFEHGNKPSRRKTSVKGNAEGLVPRADSEETVNIPEIATKVVKIVVGQRDASTLIVNRFSEKARRMMLDNQTQAAKKPKERRNPQADFKASKYIDAKGRECVPAGWFRRAIIESATFLGRQVSMKYLAGALFIRGPELIPIKFKRCVMREDVVRNTNGVADLRFRAEYFDWEVHLEIEYESTLISSGQLVALLDRAGFAIGVGEWRPQKKGEHGRFEVRSA